MSKLLPLPLQPLLLAVGVAAAPQNFQATYYDLTGPDVDTEQMYGAEF